MSERKTIYLCLAHMSENQGTHDWLRVKCSWSNFGS